MKSILKKIFALIAMASFLFLSSGCEKEGTAEKAGKEVDRAFDSAKQKMNDATK